MKITELTIRGFRSLNDVTWNPGALNVVIGPNASGKSNLLRFFHLIAQTSTGSLADHVQRQGGIDALLWDGRAREISVILRTTADAIPGFADLVGLWYEFSLDRVGSTPYFQIGSEKLFGLEDGIHNSMREILGRARDKAFLMTGDGTAILVEESLVPDESLLSALSGPLVPTAALPFVLNYLNDWRVHNGFSTDPDSAIRQSNVARVEHRLSPDGQNLVSVLHTLYTGDREFKRAINAAMQAAFGEEFEEIVFPPAADQRVQMRVRWRSLKRETSAADLSDGTLRFLFLITALANPKPSSLIAIDEPETGLHPGMLPIVAEYARDAATRTQVVFTTHSPEFLDAFGNEPPTTTVATLDEGKTHLKVLSDDALRYWLREYSLGRLFRSGELEELE